MELTGRRVPPGPRRIPPLDDLRALRQSPLAAMQRVAAVYGDLVRYPLGPMAVYLASHPDYARHVLQDNSRNYSKDTFQYNFLKSVTGEGLLTSDGPTWLRQRRLAQPAFRRERILTFAEVMAAATDDMLGRWEPYAQSGRPLDIAAEMMRVALDIVSKALFSIDMSTQAASLAEAVLEVLDYIVWRARSFGLIPGFLPTRRNRDFRTALRKLDRAAYELIQERRPGAGGERDLLSMLMGARDPETGTGMSDRQLRDEIVTLLVAGHETVASALTWTWYLLARSPEAEARLHVALAQSAEAKPQQSTSFGRSEADFGQTPYPRMVFEEALRLYPPAWIITRRALAADEIGGYEIPAGAMVVLSPYVTQRQAAYWAEPERFEPERFSLEGSRGRQRFSYFPFGGGPRLCIGNHFALLEAQVVIAKVASRYRLELPPGQRVEVEPGVTLRPQHGLPMIVKPLESMTQANAAGQFNEKGRTSEPII